MFGIDGNQIPNCRCGEWLTGATLAERSGPRTMGAYAMHHCRRELTFHTLDFVQYKVVGPDGVAFVNDEMSAQIKMFPTSLASMSMVIIGIILWWNWARAIFRS